MGPWGPGHQGQQELPMGVSGQVLADWVHPTTPARNIAAEGHQGQPQSKTLGWDKARLGYGPVGGPMTGQAKAVGSWILAQMGRFWGRR